MVPRRSSKPIAKNVYEKLFCLNEPQPLGNGLP